MKRLASLRFDGALDANQRADAARKVASCAAAAISWEVTGRRSYALVSLGPDASSEALASVLPEARVDAPPLTLLSIRASGPVGRLFDAVAGPGRPAGVLEAYVEGNQTIVELDSTKTPLPLLVDVIDIELPHRARSIVPLFGLSDEELAGLASAALRAPELDASRILERFTEPLLAGEGRA